MPAVDLKTIENQFERIIVALDVDSPRAALEIIEELGDSVGAYKVGLQLFTAAGPGFVRELTKAGHRVFLDLKFHDIPNTVAHAGIEAAKLEDRGRDIRHMMELMTNLALVGDAPGPGDDQRIAYAAPATGQQAYRVR